MNKQFNKRIKIIALSSLLLIVVSFSFSFAYIRGGTKNNESVSTVALKGGNINVRYSNNSGDIIADDIVPGYEVTKKFTVTSEFGNRDYYKSGVWYTVALIIDKNDFDDNSIEYSISMDDTSNSDGLVLPNRENIGVPNGSTSNRVIIGSGRIYSNNVSHTYNLKISYPYRTGNQSHEIGREFHAHIDIIDTDFVKLTLDLDGGSINNLYLYNNSVDLPENSLINLPIPTKENYVFAGWKAVEDSNIINDYIITNTNNIQLRALWAAEFQYTGVEQQFIAQYTGYYKIETWGAQGGNVNGIPMGGYGGYSRGIVYLNQDKKLYVNVGGKGSAQTSRSASIVNGGYNGGGSAFGATDKYVASGGGATHISENSGLLKNLTNNLGNIYIVSGGGGGSGYQESIKHGIGGNGGGVIGNSGTSSTGSHTLGAGGNQESGGSGTETGGFGLGGSSTSNGTAGGGGLYGGGSGQYYNGGGGGSGYIGNSLLTDKYMYCYKCETSDVESTKTYTTTCTEETPTENCAKIGDGFARITFLHS